MYIELNKKYTDLCAEYGVIVQIYSVTKPDVPRYKINEENGIFTLEVNANAPSYLGYEKYLAWAVRDVLLPRLVLETEHLLLRRFADADIENCLTLLSNEEDCYLDCCRCFKEKDEDYYQRVALFIQRETQYAVVLKSDASLIGTLNVFPDTARAVDAMEIGYSIAHAYQRKGYATEMLTAILDLLQEKLLVDTVSAGTLPENDASIGLLKKIGFQAEGIRHHAVWHEVPDKPVDMKYFYRDRKGT